MTKGKRVLITGITGFVGPYLATKLLSMDYEVYGLVKPRAEGNRSRRIEKNKLLNSVRFLDGDLTDLTSLLFALEKSRPDVIFHLASQSYIPRSFSDPLETFRVNSLGTQNLLEAVRLKELDCKILFAGSSEEYGLQIISKRHYRQALKKYGVIFPEPERECELPVDEKNPLRPVSPYGVSKVHDDFLMRTYYHAYGMKTIVSRAFNHEGAGRGHEFVTSTIVRQCVSLKFNEQSEISIGNVNVFRDWSHVDEIVSGYLLLSNRGAPGDVYVQGSMRTNSVLTYLLLTLKHLGFEIKAIESLRQGKKVRDPTDPSQEQFFETMFEKTKVDELMLRGELEYGLRDKGVRIKAKQREIIVRFDPGKLRQAEVPTLMSNTSKVQRLGFKAKKNLTEIIRDQTNYYLDWENRRALPVLRA